MPREDNGFLQPLVFLQDSMNYTGKLNFSIYWNSCDFPAPSPPFYLFIFLLKSDYTTT